MDGWIDRIGAALSAPLFYVADPLRRVYWVYLLSAIAMGAAVYLYQKRWRGRALLKEFIAFIAPAQVYRHRSARLDYWFFYFNGVLGGLVLAPLVAAPAVAAFVTARLGGPAPAADGVWWSIGLTIATLLAMDVALYIGHWLQHKVPVLWEFHKVHHSAEVLTPITAFRVHPVDDLLTMTLTSLFVGAVQGVFNAAVGTGIADVEVLGVNLLLFGWYVFGFHLRHSHVWLAYPAWLSHILISPAQHQVHHSAAPRHFDRNMGFIFAFWDVLGGTLYVPKTREALTYGLHGGESGEFASASALFLRPFLRLVGSRLRLPATPRPSPQ